MPRPPITGSGVRHAVRLWELIWKSRLKWSRQAASFHRSSAVVAASSHAASPVRLDDETALPRRVVRPKQEVGRRVFRVRDWYYVERPSRLSA